MPRSLTLRISPDSFQMSISPSSRDIVLAASVSPNSKPQVGSLTFGLIVVEGFSS